MNDLAENRAAVDALNVEMAGLTAAERVAQAVEVFGDDLILTTSFGPTAGVMIKLATDAMPGIRVVTLRHGYESSETLALAEGYRRRFRLNLRVYEAPFLPVPDDGSPEFEAFRRAVKIEPFARALAVESPRGWLSGVMRSETPERRRFDYVMPREGVAAVYPILDWEETDAEEFCLAHGLPVNRSYYDPAKGVGQKKECGLHLGALGSSWTSSGL